MHPSIHACVHAWMRADSHTCICTHTKTAHTHNLLDFSRGQGYAIIPPVGFISLGGKRVRTEAQDHKKKFNNIETSDKSKSGNVFANIANISLVFIRHISLRQLLLGQTVDQFMYANDNTVLALTEDVPITTSATLMPTFKIITFLG